MASCSSPESDIFVRNNEAMMTDVILDTIFSLLSFLDLKDCRLVCKRWSVLARTHLFKQSVVKFGVMPTKCIARIPPDDYYGKLFCGIANHWVDNQKKARDVIEYLNALDSDSRIFLKQLTVRASLVAEYAGDLILHSRIRDGITILDITLYPIQLEWFKVVIQDLRNLKELRVTATNMDRCRRKAPPAPPPEFQKKYLGMDGEVPPTLTFPDEYLGAHRDSKKEDLGIETLILHSQRNTEVRNRNLDEEVSEYLQTCLINEDPSSFSSWIVSRAPKLKNIHLISNMRINFAKMIDRISLDYRGSGLQSLICNLSDFKWSTSTEEENTTALLAFFDKWCLKTLKELVLEFIRISPQIMLSSPLFPSSTLTKLSITETNVVFHDTDLDWILNSDLSWTLKVKDGRLEEGDFLQFFPRTCNLNVLRYLNLRFNAGLQLTGFNRYRCNFKRLEPRRMYVRTRRVFPSVETLDMHTYGAFHMFVNVVDDFETCFPNLRILNLCNFDMARLNKYLLGMPTQLEAITLDGRYMNYVLTDKDLLKNNAILRFAKLTNFVLRYVSTKFTDGLIINGFLKLSNLRFLSFPTEAEYTPFGEDILKRLRDKPCEVEIWDD